MIQNSPAAWSLRAESVQDSAEAVMWSAMSQKLRHELAIRMLDPVSGETLLDYGCGTGALVDSLPVGVGYLGYDWSVGMVDRARDEHPHKRFVTMLPWGERYDLCAVIGTFNLADRWSAEQTWATIQRIWKKVERAMVVSLYAGADKNCISYQKSEALRVGATMGRPLTWKPMSHDIFLLVTR